ncbi:conjugal transfer protein [Thalassobacillus pellis]|uniref:conjugal transfer protein n=1 Tax=Thalassobacillus pellis TaxID=748008 RepID=UPI0019619D76|nr:conjugal transfer protein [Thalassobacillus pellis]MBM7554572.1 hypothetical protein [Thalassobacillus pellis]
MEPRLLRTYNNVWKVQKVLYGIQDIRLPIPVSYRQLAFFAGTVWLMWLLNHFPPLSLLQLELLEYVVIPGAAAWFFTKYHIDGKVPHRFLFRVMQYQWEPRLQNRYKEVSTITKPYRYTSTIGYRERDVVKRGESDED